MADCKALSTPMPTDTVRILCRSIRGKEQPPPTVPYRELVGGLMYLSIVSRPDIAYSVGILSRYMYNYSMHHWKAAKNVLLYLKGTHNYGIVYNGKKEFLAYCDADWGGDVKSRKSTSGFVATIGGTALAWKIKLQSVVAASTLEAEYISQALATRELLWLRGLAIDMGMMTKNSVLALHGDNTGAIALAHESSITPKTKHIDISYHLTRDYIQKELVSLSFLATEKQPADMFTKALPSLSFNKHRENVGVVECEEISEIP